MVSIVAFVACVGHAPLMRLSRAALPVAGPTARPLGTIVACALPESPVPDAEGGTPRLSGPAGPVDSAPAPFAVGPTEEDLLSDIARFKEKDAASTEAAAQEGPDLAMTVINGLGIVLTFNFVIIVGLFLWFLAGAIAQLAFASTVLINAFRSAWDPFILPLLTTHMALTFLSKGIEKVTGKEADGSVGGGWDLKL